MENQKPDSGFFQTVVVDDGSADGTAEFLRSYSRDLKLDPVILTRNSGRAAARNAGVNAAEGKLLLFIDGDMEFDCGLVMGHQAEYSDAEIVVLGRVVYKKSLPCKGYRNYIETRGAHKLPPETPIPGRYFWSGHVSMPKDIFIRVGGFDEHFQVYGGEDIDIGMRIVSQGFQIKYLPELVTEHLHIRSLDNVLSMAREYGSRSIPLLVNKHPALFFELKLDWLQKGGVLGFIRRLIVSSLVYSLAKKVGFILNNIRAPAKLYDYLIFRNYFVGYQSTIKS